MKSLEESVVSAMDGKDQAILPFLPYLLQDFWEIGSDPEIITEFIRKHWEGEQPPKVLDLGCGKGAVSVIVSKNLGALCFGLDAISEFISYAEEKAEEHGVRDRCAFTIGDMRDERHYPGVFDVIILGATGPVLGNYHQTFMKLKPHLSENGLVIVDDAYTEDETNASEGFILSKNQLDKQVSDAGMTLIDERVAGAETAEQYDVELGHLERRGRELISRYPDKAAIIQDYLDTQKVEYQNLKTEMVCSTMVFRRGA
ncbi:class I SAM-dependent methyltransferase [Balneolaceae bacterium ANBcel3]|nr:class I SAM-dependent methyltransferase [Balneolaceae bacterium ANBcel3]